MKTVPNSIVSGDNIGTANKGVNKPFQGSATSGPQQSKRTTLSPTEFAGGKVRSWPISTAEFPSVRAIFTRNFVCLFVRAIFAEFPSLRRASDVGVTQRELFKARMYQSTNAPYCDRSTVGKTSIVLDAGIRSVRRPFSYLSSTVQQEIAQVLGLPHLDTDCGEELSVGLAVCLVGILSAGLNWNRRVLTAVCQQSVTFYRQTLQ